MDKELTLKLQQWVQSDDAARDYTEGAVLLLQLSGNKIMYQNIIRNPQAYKEHIDYQLQKYLGWRLAELTHEEVAAMAAQVDTIVEKRGLKNPVKAADESASQGQKAKKSKKKVLTDEEKRLGKRVDHDDLPQDIQALYIENASILQRMRMLHERLCIVSEQPATCPDSERYPYLKELIELDKRYHDNWLQYDSWAAE